MSGVFGVIDTERRTDLQQLVTKIIDKLSHKEWFVAHSFVDEEHNLALGQIGIGIFNQIAQPVWNESRTIALVMAGEFHNIEQVGKKDEVIALEFYEKLGENFIRHLSGAFIIAIWDKVKNRLIIANDRFGLYPLYYAHYDQKFVFSPELKGVLCDNDFRKELNLTALAEYMRFQQLLGEKTFLENIKLLPYASILNYDLHTNTFDIKKYWDFSEIKENRNISFEEAVDEVSRLFKQVVNRMVSDNYRPGVYLSAGMDSRLIAGCIDQENFPITTINYGQKYCYDVYFAKEIANSVGSDHHWIELRNGKWVEENVDFHFDLTEGFHSWLHAHGINTLAHARKFIDVNLTGWAVDTLLGGHFWDPELVCAVDDVAFYNRLFYSYNQKFTWPGIEEGEEEFLYAHKYRARLQRLAIVSLFKEVDKFKEYDYSQRVEFFNQINHNGRFTFCHLITGRSHFEMRSPACDYTLFDFVSSIPLKLRPNRQLQIAIINKIAPNLAKIPSHKHGNILTEKKWSRNSHFLKQGLKRRFNRYIYPLFPSVQLVQLYADYENYLRNDLRSWAENILFDEKTLERGIFNPKFIQSIWKRHQSGLELHTVGKIAPIITYEMVLREFFD